MSLQTILSICESVGINDQKFIGQTLSRSQKIVTSEVMTVIPFVFDLKPNDFLLYSRSRGILNTLRINDRLTPQYMSFGSTGWLNYIKYQGDMTAAQIAACQWQTSSQNTTLVLGSLPAISSTAYMFRVGDFVQVGLYAYIVTADVLRGSGTTVSVPVHRNLLQPVTSAVALVAGQYGTTVSMGGSTYTGVTFGVVLREYPTYTLVPMTNDSFIQWNGPFKAHEYIV